MRSAGELEQALKRLTLASTLIQRNHYGLCWWWWWFWWWSSSLSHYKMVCLYWLLEKSHRVWVSERGCVEFLAFSRAAVSNSMTMMMMMLWPVGVKWGGCCVEHNLLFCCGLAIIFLPMWFAFCWACPTATTKSHRRHRRWSIMRMAGWEWAVRRWRLVGWLVWGLLNHLYNFQTEILQCRA